MVFLGRLVCALVCCFLRLSCPFFPSCLCRRGFLHVRPPTPLHTRRTFHRVRAGLPHNRDGIDQTLKSLITAAHRPTISHLSVLASLPSACSL
ncbi:hypothetical protein B0T24DRAFT_625910 [Lasiosphaeria ovina]|uniref:Secreted protein n=1 Tax=Lasiosphaeria ovina TaxID=92902 RepID=A0AAE0KCN5_9PEZI|nr:hypothetical protein B0T24DRAFT_625910 [Lasiosphaeria ovina]